MVQSLLKSALMIFTFVFSATAVSAQAFGIEMSKPLSELEVTDDLGDGFFIVVAPRPHSEFESYVVVATDETGVCMVRGVGKDHDNDRFGLSVRDSYSSLRSALKKRYGKYERVEFLRSGALWDDSDEWVMSIRQNERAHQAVWEEKSGSELSAGLKDIILEVSATSSDTSWIALQYRFDNMDECDRILAEQDESGL